MRQQEATGPVRAAARAAPPPEAASWYRRWRSDLLLAAVVLFLAVPNLQPLMAQQASRYALTAALYDQRTVVLDDYEHTLGVDFSIREGRLYSDKAPGQPVWALPAYAFYRLLGGEPATIYRPWGNLGLWATSVWSAAVPAAALAVVMRRLALRVAPRQATVAALGMAVASLLLPFSTVLFSHVLSALAALASYALLLPRSDAQPDRTVSAGAIAGAGALAAAGIAVEYTAALAAAILLVVTVFRHRRRVGWFVLGGVGPGLLLAAYQWAAFGGPLRFSYHFSRFDGHQSGIVGVQAPQSDMLMKVLLGDRGLFFLTPIVLVGVVGAAMLLRDPARRRYGLVALSTFTLYLLVQVGWGNATGGASPGARYVVPALPFLVLGVAEAWRRWPVAGWLATIFGFVTMGLATFTLPLAPRDHPFALAYWIERIQQGEWAQTLLTRPFGTTTLFLPVAVAVALAAWLVVTERSAAAGVPPRPRDQRDLQRQS